jgi:type IX secretion system PorP/SprF family membrane protein
MKKYFLLFSILLLLLGSFQVFAQDIQFSQFYAVPLYQNPAFAGSAHTTRAMLHQRLQWPSLDSKYITSLFSVDHYFANYNSGVGLMVYRDWQGGGTLNSTTASLSYSYEINLNSNWTFRPGLSAGMVNRTIDYEKLRFPSQFSDTIGYLGSSSNFNGAPSIFYADFSTGGIMYNKNLWVGFAADHINSPNQSLIKDVSRLPVKYSLSGGYKIILRKEKSAAYLEAQKQVSITPTFLYKSQGKADQFDAGIYALYGELMAGFWYRGIPIKKYASGIQNNESLIFLLGWKVKDFAISYSYDVTISKLATYRTGGAHELNLTWFSRKHYKPRKPMKRLPCPQFYKH